MTFIEKLFGNKNTETLKLSKEEIAKLLKTSPEILKTFETVYKNQVLDVIPEDTDFFSVNAKQASAMANHDADENVDDYVDRIVAELLNDTQIYSYNGEYAQTFSLSGTQTEPPVTLSEIKSFPIEVRPQLTGYLMKKDINGDSYETLLQQYYESKTNKDAKMRKMYYNMFRQGLDILDLDPITYEIIGTNPNSMGYWFPPLVEAAGKQNFFKIPKTTIVKVPLPMLQLTRTDYNELTSTTLRIVDEFCMKAFNLDVNKEYFIKTGTYSSKFDFRNAVVRGEKEVRELGEYLLFIHFQALMMASPLCKPCIYGVSTTNDWVVREYIPDVENNPCIYKGLPLHTEYRVFVDFDEDEVLGMNPYWKPDVMKQRFGHEEDADSPNQKHDYIIYLAHEETLMKRYEDNKEKVHDAIQNLIPNINLPGQWAIDVMQNGDDFYIIDMSLAENSSLNDCIPKEKRKKVEEDWIPKLPLSK